jgi:hypothetical protein
MIDLSLEEDLGAHFLAADMGHNDDERVGALLNHPLVHVGASDGGAHILSFSTYGDTGYLFSRFVRDTERHASGGRREEDHQRDRPPSGASRTAGCCSRAMWPT